jgi:hypothetical protein
MGFRYYTKVTFPTTAMSLPEVAQAVKDYVATWSHRGVEDEGEFTSVYDEDVSYGWMDDITGVLKDLEVPYDHYHSESEGSASVPWTEYARWDGTGTELDEVQEAEAHTGAELLKLLDDGQLDKLREELVKLAGGLPSKLDADWQPDPVVVAAYREDNPPDDPLQYAEAEGG